MCLKTRGFLLEQAIELPSEPKPTLIVRGGLDGENKWVLELECTAEDSMYVPAIRFIDTHPSISFVHTYGYRLKGGGYSLFKVHAVTRDGAVKWALPWLILSQSICLGTLVLMVVLAHDNRKEQSCNDPLLARLIDLESGHCLHTWSFGFSSHESSEYTPWFSGQRGLEGQSFSGHLSQANGLWTYTIVGPQGDGPERVKHLVLDGFADVVARLQTAGTPSVG